MTRSCSLSNEFSHSLTFDIYVLIKLHLLTTNFVEILFRLLEWIKRLLCVFRIPNLEEGAMGPVVAIHGKSLLPYVHFELEESDYLSSNRRSHLGENLFTLFDGNMDPNTRVMEFESCGVNRTIKKYVKTLVVCPNFFFKWKMLFSYILLNGAN